MRTTFTLLLTLLWGTFIFAQTDQPPATPAEARINSFEQRKALIDNSLVNEIEFRNAGPTVFSGRVSDIAVDPEDPTHFYVAYSSGGLWETTDNGISFTPLFDNEMVMTIGDIAVDWKNDRIWLGSGEVNSSRSSYAGTGVFQSADNGKTWEYKGLPESHHIGRIILHPDEPTTAWVAVLGHLYSPNPERGVYKTTDGGNSWEKTLYINENAGVVDLAIDPNNPDILFAAAWERSRRAWDFVEAGEGSGIYRSDDGGDNWTLLTQKKSGFPQGELVGRIGLEAVLDEDGNTVLFATLDNYNRRPKEDKEEEEDMLTKDILRDMSVQTFIGLEDQRIETFLRNNNFPEKYSADKVKEMVRTQKITPIALVEYLEDANSLLFDTPVIGAQVFVSRDMGKSWKQTHEGYLDDLFYSYGYYFGQIRSKMGNAQKLYILGVPFLRSDDGGRTWKSIGGDNVHGDHHALWVNPTRAGHLILGNDGGINISYDDGEHWIKCNSPSVGQFYTVAVDMEEPYNIYGGLQDNGVWYGPNTYRESTRWHSSGDYPYDFLMGGDGMQVAIDTRDNNIVYTGFQFGNYYRINKQTGERQYITPQHELGERPYRWNWQSPIHLSVHNQDIFYMGGNKLFRSFNQGDDFEAISDDLTKGGRQGDVAFGTLTSIHESPLKFGLLYTGSDDGLIHVSEDGGNTWRNITEGLPQDMWVSRVQASAHELGRVYAALNGYRWDHFEPMVYVSEDYGKNWKQIGTDLPMEPVNVIKEDPENPDLLYVGTDHGVYVSLDRGKTFMGMNNQLPATPVHDLVIHPEARDLVLGTHGRSFYVADVEELQQLDPETLEEDLLVFEVDPIRHSSSWGNQGYTWAEIRSPERAIPFYSKNGGKATLSVQAGDELTLKTWEVEAVKGLNFADYDLSLEEKQLDAYTEWLNKDAKEEVKVKKADNGSHYLHKGSYTIKISQREESVETTLQIK